MLICTSIILETDFEDSFDYSITVKVNKKKISEIKHIFTILATKTHLQTFISYQYLVLQPNYLMSILSGVIMID